MIVYFFLCVALCYTCVHKIVDCFVSTTFFFILCFCFKIKLVHDTVVDVRECQ